jgi:hypothetical protein
MPSIRYPKLKNMMGNMPKPAAMPGAGAMPNPMAGAQSLKAPAPSMMSQPKMALPGAMDRAPASTLPSIASTQNEETPIELGDPKRLSRIATILRMGRK